MPSLYFRQWVFTPELTPTLVVLLAFPLLLALGFWQLHRAEEKKQLLGQYNLRIQQPPIPFKGNEPNYTPVSVTGYYDNQHTIFVDNRFFNHQPGYYVISPFMILASSRVVLINRGWAPRLTMANKMPDVAPVYGQQTLTGLAVLPQPGLLLAAQKFFGTWPWLVEDLRIKEIQIALAKPLYQSVILLSANAPYGFSRHWELVTAVPPERHQAYAVQWFILSFILVIIYIKLTLRKSHHAK